jgi:hypothetical protein
MINKITLGAVMVLGMGTFSSCLKNSKYYTDFSNNPASIDLPLAASTINGITAFSYPPTVATVTLPIYVNVASTNPLNKSVSATLGIDSVGLNSYNTSNGTNYVTMPDSVYTLSSTSVTVPAGKRLDSVTVTINLAKLDLSTPYVFPITIVNASVPIEQWNHLFYYVAVKNQWDGIYSYKGYALRAGDANRTGNFSGQQMALITSGSNSVTWGGLALWADLSGIGIGNPTLTIAPDNTVTCSAPNPSMHNLPGGSNYYDPGTQTFFVSFTWGAGPAARQSVDTLTYTGPR